MAVRDLAHLPRCGTKQNFKAVRGAPYFCLGVTHQLADQIPGINIPIVG